MTINNIDAKICGRIIMFLIDNKILSEKNELKKKCDSIRTICKLIKIQLELVLILMNQAIITITILNFNQIK